MSTSFEQLVKIFIDCIKQWVFSMSTNIFKVITIYCPHHDTAQMFLFCKISFQLYRSDVVKTDPLFTRDYVGNLLFRIPNIFPIAVKLANLEKREKNQLNELNSFVKKYKNLTRFTFII